MCLKLYSLYDTPKMIWLVLLSIVKLPMPSTKLASVLDSPFSQRTSIPSFPSSTPNPDCIPKENLSKLISLAVLIPKSVSKTYWNEGPINTLANPNSFFPNKTGTSIFLKS